ncbi:hypothetical protein ACVBEJ_05515 [Porticoccus sp. GXU_MW_L64]
MAGKRLFVVGSFQKVMDNVALRKRMIPILLAVTRRKYIPVGSDAASMLHTVTASNIEIMLTV